MGREVFSASGVLSCVTNASLKEGVGVTVSGSTSKTDMPGVCVGMMGTGVDVGGMPPSGVGVEYCPHKEALPAQDASKNDAATSEAVLWIKKPMMRFTN